MSQDFDLLGDPIPEGWGKRGRPPHIPTQENRNKIIVLMAMGWPDARIANALAITPPTLRKHYFRELRIRAAARDRVDAMRLMMLWGQMREGNVAAMKEYARQAERLDLAQTARDFAGDDEDDGASSPRMGKKEMAQAAATTAGEGSGWGSDLLGPKGPTQH